MLEVCSNKKSHPMGREACCGLVTLLRFERRTYCLEGSCSIQLSYGAIYDFELWVSKFNIFLSGCPDSNWGSPAPKAGAITGLRYIPPVTIKKTPLFGGVLRRRGDSNPRYPNRVRQFSKLLVSATHPPLRVFLLTKKHRFFTLEKRCKITNIFNTDKIFFLLLLFLSDFKVMLYFFFA